MGRFRFNRGGDDDDKDKKDNQSSRRNPLNRDKKDDKSDDSGGRRRSPFGSRSSDDKKDDNSGQRSPFGRRSDEKSDDSSSRSSFGRRSSGDDDSSSSSSRFGSSRSSSSDSSSRSSSSSRFDRGSDDTSGDSSSRSSFSRRSSGDDDSSSSSRFGSRSSDKSDDSSSRSSFSRRSSSDDDSSSSSSPFGRRSSSDDSSSSSSPFSRRSSSDDDSSSSSTPFGRRSSSDDSSSSSRSGSSRSSSSDDSSSSSSRFGSSRSSSDDSSSGSSSSRFGSSRSSSRDDSSSSSRSGSSRSSSSDDSSSSSSRFGSSRSSSSDSSSRSDDSGGRTFGRSGTSRDDSSSTSSSSGRTFGGSRSTSSDDSSSSSSSSRFGGRGSSDSKKQDNKQSGSRFSRGGKSTDKKDKTTDAGSGSNVFSRFGRSGGSDKDKSTDKSATAGGRFGRGASTEKKAKPKGEGGNFLSRLNPFGGGDSDKKDKSAKAKKPLPDQKKGVARNVTGGLDLDRKLDILGFVLIAFALLTIFGWLQTSMASTPGAGGLTETLDNIMAQLFGMGRLVISAAAAYVGGWLVLRYFGKMFDIDYWRIGGYLIIFTALLTTLQWWELLFDGFPSINYVPSLEALADQSEQLWQDGGGGGIVGHLLYIFFEQALGDVVIVVFLIIWWIAGVYLGFDLNVEKISEYVIATRAARQTRREERRKEEEERLKDAPLRQPVTAPIAVGAGVGAASTEEQPRRAGLFGRSGRTEAPSNEPITPETDGDQPQRRVAAADTSGRVAAPSNAPITADTDGDVPKRNLFGRLFGRTSRPQPVAGQTSGGVGEAIGGPVEPAPGRNLAGAKGRKVDGQTETAAEKPSRRSFMGRIRRGDSESTETVVEGRTAPPSATVAQQSAAPAPPAVEETETPKRQVEADKSNATGRRTAPPPAPTQPVEEPKVEAAVQKTEAPTPAPAAEVVTDKADTTVTPVEETPAAPEPAVEVAPEEATVEPAPAAEEKVEAPVAKPRGIFNKQAEETTDNSGERGFRPAPKPVKAEETPAAESSDDDEPAIDVETDVAISEELEAARPRGLSDSAVRAVAAITAPAEAEKDEEDDGKSKDEQAAEELQAAASAIGEGRWRHPDFRKLLEEGSEQRIEQQILLDRAKIIEDTLESFGAPGKVVEVNTGPVITQFGVEPDYIERRGGSRSRVKVSAIAGLEKDIALALAAKAIRIEAPVPGKGYVGIEVPNAESSVVSLRDVMMSENHRKTAKKSPLALALGRRVDGEPMSADLTSMPHLLIAGATGSGKSVCVNAIISCLLLQNTPEELQMIMVDPKRVELAGYNGIPHLVSPVVVDLERIVGVLKWVQREMDDRYRRFSQVGARNITDFNDNKLPNGEKRMPYLVVIVDELADLMMLAPDETERLIARLAQMARATGIHLIISTQRPSVDVVTGLIKANFPARIAFAVASSVDSRVILDQPGAEKLLGRGDMLFQAPDAPAPTRMQGAFLSDAEINRITHYWKSIQSLQNKSGNGGKPGMTVTEPQNVPQVQSRAERFSPPPAPDRRPSNPQQRFWERNTGAAASNVAQGEDELYEKAVELVRQQDRASIAMLQRNFRINHSRAQRLMQILEEKGIVEAADDNGTSVRRVLPPKEMEE